MTAHVIVSSIVLAIALLASYAPRLTARTRFAIVLLGLAKFAIPASLFTPLLPQQRPAILEISMPAAVTALATTAAAPASSIPWVRILWITIAALLIARAILIGWRAAKTTMRTATAPSPREVAALNAARRRTGVRDGIDLVRSPLSEAPAVLRILRPLIVLPADGTDTLDDDELESLLRHECAHVARRDNLIGLAEAVIRAVFWFNPLVWIAGRRLAVLREDACDERVADSSETAGIYAGALAKVCDAIISRPVAGVACMASANLKERIDSIMNYESLRASALPHRAIAALAFAAVLLFTGGAAALDGEKSRNDARYRITPQVTKNGDAFVFKAKVVDTRSSDVIANPSLRLTPNTPATVTTESGALRIVLDALVGTDGNGKVTANVFENGVRLQESTHTLQPPQRARRDSRFQGEPISMNLHEADLRDVLKTFSQLSGIEMVVAPEVQGKVTFNIEQMPWDEALHIIITERGYQYRIEGKKLYVSK